MMAGLKRITTWKQVDREPITIEVGDKTFSVSRTVLLAQNTEKKIERYLANLPNITGVALPPIFIHINRDGSIALATGKAPDIWPEDDTEVFEDY